VMPTTPEGNRDSDSSRNHVDTYLEMEKLLATGKVRAIGVANYSVKYLSELLPRATIVPAVNQIENHPSLPQHDVSDYCKAKGILVTAYSPLGSSGSPLLKMAVVERIAAKHGSSPASVLLSYHIVRGHAVLAKSVTPSRIVANRQFTKLDNEDMLALAEISKTGPLKRHVDPNWGVDLGFPDKQ
jgi:glycerol 2-dehydrogenase (NADP+)